MSHNLSSRMAALALATTILATPVLATTAWADAHSMATKVSSLQAPDARVGEMVSVDGAEIFYEAAGDGPPLMLLHGYPLSGALFARLRDELQKTHRVITIDHRGYGKSSATSNPGTIEQYAKDALAVMDALNIDEAAIGGMSMGGPITLKMLDMDPNRFSAVILIDTIAAAASPIEAGIWDGTVKVLNDKGLDGIIPFLMNKMLTGETRQAEPEQVDYLTAAMKGATLEAALGGAKALRDRPDQTAVLEKLEMPVLVFVGLEDTVYSFEVSKGMVDTIGDNAKLAIIDGASHAAVFEKPVEAGKAIADFLSGVVSSSN